MIRVAQFRFTVTLATVPVYRNALVHSIVDLAGVALDDDLAYALRLCSSELLANGVEHAGLGDAAELLVEGDLDKHRKSLRITVTDGGLTVPDMVGGLDDLSATGGRGLAVVSGFAKDVGWGQRRDDADRIVGWSVWFELDVQLPSPTAQAEDQLVGNDLRAGQRRASPMSEAARPGDYDQKPARLNTTGRHVA
ncbi:ATP-binding protein [Streptomyces sp. NRRL S-495]|uniref:ATP-binding protein n=1 Tax=Streptomyces sp. NRRL S-495 TaxID=1609133 RepID=UPI0006961687|nr:ATP-binding protein [Streptomyces sp. NRRL S-495]